MNRYKITLFITDNCERQSLEPIAEEASARGIPVRFSDDANEPADIGFYCAHLARPNARLSFIMLHDMAQAHNVWPNFWMQEPWNAFDFGFFLDRCGVVCGKRVNICVTHNQSLECMS